MSTFIIKENSGVFLFS